MFDKIRQRLGFSGNTNGNIPESQERTDVSKIQAFLRGWDIDGNLNETRALDPYVQNITVFRCINAIATAITTARFDITSEKQSIKSGAIYDLMQQPNPMMDQSTFFEFVATAINSSGNCYIYVDDPDSNGIPRSLLPFSSYFIEPERGDFIYELKYWKLKTKNGRFINIPKENIIQIRYAPNPTDPIIGVGPMQVAALAIDSDWSAGNYNKNILRNGGQPSGILVYKGPGRLTEEMKDEIRQAWQRTYGGPRNAFRLAVMNNEWSFQQTGTSQRDMEFADSRKWNLHDISRAFGVPLIYLNDYETSGNSYTGLEIQRKMFYEDVIMPLAYKISSALSRELLSRIDKRMRCDFNFTNVIALREDFAKKVEAAEKLSKMGFSLNNINKRLDLGMTPEPWGDEHLAPVNMVPAGDIVNHSVQLPSSQVQQELQGQAGVSQKKETKKKVKEDPPVDESNSPPDDKSRSEYSEAISYVKENELKCTGKLHRVLLSQRASVLSKLDSVPGQEDINQILSAHESMAIEVIADAFMPSIMNSYLDGVEMQSVKFVESGKLLKSQVDIIGERSKVEAANYCNQRYDYLIELADEFRSVVGKEIKDGAERQESVNDIKARIKKVSNRIIRKVEVVCKTEVFAAFNHGRYDVASNADRVTFDQVTLEWIRGDSEYCSRECENNEPVKYGEPFANGKRFPGDGEGSLVIGCNCILNVV
jgi:HK97 family phage portal protein